MLDVRAILWLENYLQVWPMTHFSISIPLWKLWQMWPTLKPMTLPTDVAVHHLGRLSRQKLPECRCYGHHPLTLPEARQLPWWLWKLYQNQRRQTEEPAERVWGPAAVQTTHTGTATVQTAHAGRWSAAAFSHDTLLVFQVFIDRFRYNANRAAQVQSKLKLLERLWVQVQTCEKQLLTVTLCLIVTVVSCRPELKPLEKEPDVTLK